jgi:hypothetical protein
MTRVPRGYELVDVGPGIEPFGEGWELTYAAAPLRNPAYTVRLTVRTSTQRALSQLRLPSARAVDVHGHVGVLVAAPPFVGDIKISWDIDPTTEVTVEALTNGGAGRVPVSVNTVLALARSAHPVPMSTWNALVAQLQSPAAPTAPTNASPGTVPTNPLVVPAVQGMPETTATTLLNQRGLRVTIQRNHSQTVAAGVVIAEDPPAGTRVPEGSTVMLSVSSG